jgi:hypothetical protein
MDDQDYKTLTPKQLAYRLRGRVKTFKSLKAACDDRCWDYGWVYKALKAGGELEPLMAAKYETTGAAQ